LRAGRVVLDRSEEEGRESDVGSGSHTRGARGLAMEEMERVMSYLVGSSEARIYTPGWKLP
jgi:hypothetical protein